MAEEKPNFSGSWKLVKSENFEEFLGANGANWIVRKMASKSSPRVDITQEGDKFVIKTVTAMRTQEDNFSIGEPYTSVGFSGIKMKVTPSWDGGVIVLEKEPVEDDGKGKNVNIRREIADGQLLMTMTTDDIVCKRWFDKI